MGLLDFFKHLFGKAEGVGPIGKAPSPEFPDAVTLFEKTLCQLFEHQMQDGWATFEADGAEERLVIQVAGMIVNTCRERIDLSSLLKAAGLSGLADRVIQLEEDIFEIRGAGPHELAQVVDAVFRHHYRLPSAYSVMAEVEA